MCAVSVIGGYRARRVAPSCSRRASTSDGRRARACACEALAAARSRIVQPARRWKSRSVRRPLEASRPMAQRQATGSVAGQGAIAAASDSRPRQAHRAYARSDRSARDIRITDGWGVYETHILQSVSKPRRMLSREYRRRPEPGRAHVRAPRPDLRTRSGLEHKPFDQLGCPGLGLLRAREHGAWRAMSPSAGPGAAPSAAGPSGGGRHDEEARSAPRLASLEVDSNTL